MEEATDHEWNGKPHISNNAVDRQKLLAALQRRVNVDMDLQACKEALTGFDTYYKMSHRTRSAKSNADFSHQVALKMFVDNFCKQVVEPHLIRNMLKVFQPESVILLNDEDLRRMAAEPFGNTEKQEELRILLENLMHSLNDLQN